MHQLVTTLALALALLALALALRPQQLAPPYPEARPSYAIPRSAYDPPPAPAPAARGREYYDPPVAPPRSGDRICQQVRC